MADLIEIFRKSMFATHWMEEKLKGAFSRYEGCKRWRIMPDGGQFSSSATAAGKVVKETNLSMIAPSIFGKDLYTQVSGIILSGMDHALYNRSPERR